VQVQISLRRMVLKGDSGCVNGLIIPAHLRIDRIQNCVCVGMIRMKLDRFLKFGNRFIVPAWHVVCPTDIRVCARGQRVEGSTRLIHRCGRLAPNVQSFDKPASANCHQVARALVVYQTTNEHLPMLQPRTWWPS
jgi:hypothetical protein